ncbi:MAG: hypothetical protein ACXAC7_07940 [Candidatus Hodarchaeales archaeon]|jgi:hypothetical protein
MSNELAKEEVLVEAVRAVLIADNTDTGGTVREIDFYCGDRIYMADKNLDNDFPQIFLNTDAAPDQQLLPSGNYFLETTCCVKMDYTNAQQTMYRMDSRVLALINKKPDTLNLAVPSKNLRCRLILKMSSIRFTDPIAQLYLKNTRFRVILDDETLV